MSSQPTDIASPLVVQPAMPVGDRLGPYLIEGLIGSGSMGEVYAAHDTRLGRRVALKVVRAVGSELLAEAQAMARLSHPNVVTIYEAGVLGGHVFLALELVEGQTMREWLAETPRAWRDIVAAYAAAGRGLAAAHAAGIVHRDIKPDNVLIGFDGRVRVGDFGLASRPGASGGPAPDELGTLATVDGGAVSASGTPAYMAPEQHIGGDVDARADQFAFCVALYEALYGQRPFEGGTTSELRRRVLAGQRDRAPRAAGVPARLLPIVLRGLEPERDARWPSMDALVDALTHDPTARRRWIAAGAVLAAAIGVAAYGFLRPTPRGSGCTGAVARSRLRGTWDEEVKARVHTALLAVGEPGAEPAFARASAALDGYAADFVSMRRATCKAVQKGERTVASAEVLYACLDRRLLVLEALATLFVHADATVLAHAGVAAQGLEPLATCAASREGWPPQSIEPQVHGVRERMARAIALDLVGYGERALVLAREVAGDVTGVDYEPVRAEAAALLARLEADQPR